jgi:hypothetical protein
MKRLCERHHLTPLGKFLEIADRVDARLLHPLARRVHQAVELSQILKLGLTKASTKSGLLGWYRSVAKPSINSAAMKAWGTFFSYSICALALASNATPSSMAERLSVALGFFAI